MPKKKPYPWANRPPGRRGLRHFWFLRFIRKGAVNDWLRNSPDGVLYSMDTETHNLRALLQIGEAVAHLTTLPQVIDSAMAATSTVLRLKKKNERISKSLAERLFRTMAAVRAQAALFTLQGFYDLTKSALSEPGWPKPLGDIVFGSIHEQVLKHIHSAGFANVDEFREAMAKKHGLSYQELLQRAIEEVPMRDREFEREVLRFDDMEGAQDDFRVDGPIDDGS